MNKYSAYFLIFFILLLTIPCFAQNETITITTYYPAPYGVYQNLRLAPSSQPTCTNSSHEGLMYYDSTSHLLRICTTEDGGATYIWKSVTGAGSSGTSVGQKFCLFQEPNPGPVTASISVPVPSNWVAANCANLLSQLGMTGRYGMGCIFADGSSRVGSLAPPGSPTVPSPNCGW